MELSENFDLKEISRYLDEQLKVECRIFKKRICYHGTLVKNMVNFGNLAKIMVEHG